MTVSSGVETATIRDEPEPIAFAVALYLAVGAAHFLGALLALSARPAADWQSIPTVEVALGLAVLVGCVVGLADASLRLERLTVGVAGGCLLYLALVWFGLVGVTAGSVATVEPPLREFAFAAIAGPLAAVAAGATRRFLVSE